MKKQNLVAPAIFVLCFIIFLPFARLGIDVHHDGIVFQVARVIARGGVIHRDVFSQYGQLSAYVDAISLKLFGFKILVLHISSVVILSIAIAFFAESWRRMYGSFVAVASALMCIGTAYFFLPSADYQLVAWASDKTLLLMGILSLIGTSKLINQKSGWFSIGLICVMVSSTRIQMGVCILLMFIVFLVFSNQIRFLAPLICGFMTLLIVAICLMFYLDIASEWWTQVIIWPKLFSNTVSLSNWLYALRDIFGLSSIPILLFIFVLLATFKLIARISTQFDSSKRLAQIVIILALLLLYLRTATETSTEFWSLGRLTRFGDGGGYPHFFINGYAILWVCFFSLIYSAPYSLLEVRKFVKQRNITGLLDRKEQTSFAQTYCLLLGIASSVQLYPLLDARHVWWALIPSTGPAFGFIISRFSPSQHRNLKVSTIFLLLLVFSQGLVSIYATTTTPRIKLEGVPIIEGSLISLVEYPGRFSSIFLAKQYLDQYQDRPIINMCPDGIYSSLTNSIKMPDPYFVDWLNLTEDILVKDSRRQFWKLRETFMQNHHPLVWWCDLQPRSTGEREVFTTRNKIVWLTKNLGVVRP